MVRNNPADALAILDEVWSGARHTETGWYLRASSLALLGLPGEAARVAADAVMRNPQSAANHFLRSLAQLSLGELQAARASVAEAVRHSEPDALLLVQSALLEAQSGNVNDAEQLLRRAAAQWPEHPALAYGRRMIREVMHNASRDTPFAPNNVRDASTRGQIPDFLRTPVSVQSLGEEELAPAAGWPDASAATSVDIITDSLQQLGAKLRTGTASDITRAAREMMTSLATGGALANGTSPARAHAMRGVVSAILSAVNTSGKTASVGWAAESVGGQWQRAASNSVRLGYALEQSGIESHDVLIERARALVAALRDGRVDEAQVHLRRSHGALDNMSRVLLQALIPAQQSASPAEPNFRLGSASPGETDGSDGSVRASAMEPALLTPIRLGLALLPETDLLNHALRPVGMEDSAVSYAAMHSATAFSETTAGRAVPPGSVPALVAAAGVFALAVLALAFRQTLVGVALIGAGAWLLLRKHSDVAGAAGRR